MDTLGALDPRLLADTMDPFVRAGRCMSGLPSPPALESTWIDVLSPPEERPEEPDLHLRRGLMIDAAFGPGHLTTTHSWPLVRGHCRGVCHSGEGPYCGRSLTPADATQLGGDSRGFQTADR